MPTTTDTASTIEDLRAEYRASIATGTNGEHRAAKVALIQASTGRELTPDQITYL